MLTHLIIIFITSLVAGFMGGQVGGGGLLNLPMLLLLGLDPLVAIGTNKLAALFPVLISASNFYKHRNIPFKRVLFLGMVCLMGSLSGAFILLYFQPDSQLLKKMTIFVLVIVSLIFLFRPNLGLSEQEFKPSKKNYALVISLLFIVSIYGGIFSLAATTFLATVFTLHKQSFLQSMSYALVLTFIILFSSSIVFVLQNQVNYQYALVQALGGSIGAGFGSRLAIKKGNLWIKNFSLVIVFILLLKLILETYS